MNSIQHHSNFGNYTRPTKYIIPTFKMTEVSFAKTFLGLLDSRPQKLSADHVEDAKNYPARPPVSAWMETPYAVVHTILTVYLYSISSPKCQRQ